MYIQNSPINVLAQPLHYQKCKKLILEINATGCPQEKEWVNFKHNRMNDMPGNPRSVRTLAQLRVYLSRWARWLAIGLGEVQTFFMECLQRHMPTLASTSSGTSGSSTLTDRI